MSSIASKSIAINVLPGGFFSLSRLAIEHLRRLHNPYALRQTLAGESGYRGSGDDYCCHGIPREDKDLIYTISKLGSASYGSNAILAIVNISFSKYRIQNDGGLESVLSLDLPFKKSKKTWSVNW